LLQLEFRIGGHGQLALFLFDGGAGPLEVKARGDLLLRLLDGILHFDHIGFQNYIKRRHNYFLFVRQAARMDPAASKTDILTDNLPDAAISALVFCLFRSIIDEIS
jgi:hypothetical protein